MSQSAALITVVDCMAMLRTGAASRSRSESGVPSASRHTRTVRSRPPLTITGVPSGSAPTATARTASVWPLSGPPTGAPSASRHTRTVPSS